MSLGKVAGPLLAIVCGVCTAYTTFAPELQKQQAERLQGSDLKNQNPNTLSVSSSHETEIDVQPPNQTAISNDASVGAAVKEAVNSAKDPAKGSSWPGLSMLRWSFGGEDAEKSPGKKDDGGQ
ncbi:hypothetical protein H2203_006762 [Taxawa tesnikishii (nom. ined.)]|nr:hypothetical protein H2203_006762 [Dothideales sp. JES 119]